LIKALIWENSHSGGVKVVYRMRLDGTKMEGDSPDGSEGGEDHERVERR
jgi:hypothetical protein